MHWLQPCINHILTIYAHTVCVVPHDVVLLCHIFLCDCSYMHISLLNHNVTQHDSKTEQKFAFTYFVLLSACMCSLSVFLSQGLTCLSVSVLIIYDTRDFVILRPLSNICVSTYNKPVTFAFTVPSLSCFWSHCWTTSRKTLQGHYSRCPVQPC